MKDTAIGKAAAADEGALAVVRVAQQDDEVARLRRDRRVAKQII